MRGKPLWSSRRGLTSRITPAGAGKTTFMADIAACIWDHPRRCGENFFSKKGVDICLGSPPRMRGKHFDSIAETADGRITPAYAGKTF